MLFHDNRMLFFDQRDIERAENVKLVMNPPSKRGACLLLEREWELGGMRPLCIVEWQGTYRLYYRVSLGEDKVALAFVTSADGITWEHPDLGVLEFAGSTANNLVDIGDHQPNEVCVFVDPSAPEEHRFKLVGHSQHEGGMYAMTSPDGLRFTRIEGHLLEYIVDNHKSAFYDERIGRYVIYLRGWDRSRPIPPMQGSRTILRAETDDLFKSIAVDENAPDRWPVSPKWSDIEDRGLRRMNRELPTVMACDEHDPPEAGLYQAAAVHYQSDAYLAFPSLYYSYPWPPDGPFINDGTLDLQFASSRDGISWQRDFRGSYVRLDLPDGPCTRMMHMLVGMVPNGHHISQYYVGSRRSHGEGRVSKDTKVDRRPAQYGDDIVYRLEQRMDGFVSADSAYTGGVLVTKPFVLRNAELVLNIDTSASGCAHAALLAEDGSGLPGVGLRESELIQTNDTRHVLRWNGQADLSRFTGHRIKLLLQSRNTKLFSVSPKM